MELTGEAQSTPPPGLLTAERVTLLMKVLFRRVVSEAVAEAALARGFHRTRCDRVAARAYVDSLPAQAALPTPPGPSRSADAIPGCHGRAGGSILGAWQ